MAPDGLGIEENEIILAEVPEVMNRIWQGTSNISLSNFLAFSEVGSSAYGVLFALYSPRG